MCIKDFFNINYTIKKIFNTLEFFTLQKVIHPQGRPFNLSSLKCRVVDLVSATLTTILLQTYYFVKGFNSRARDSARARSILP